MVLQCYFLLIVQCSYLSCLCSGEKLFLLTYQGLPVCICLQGVSPHYREIASKSKLSAVFYSFPLFQYCPPASVSRDGSAFLFLVKLGWSKTRWDPWQKKKIIT
ncbi:hypothetical protein XELAEV_18022154mg [Xenopus laevis]|uniref:Secreted protein n=1 Tax=Xenopus laevis TaxID=8355 RepID=A0A974HMY0_XENLA|nr:hypothetical protein XELAEV_18022154mg [Xenopus laevis]